jgi:hypothetical protein
VNKPILDACCGSRMFWFDKENLIVEFCDIREVPNHEFYPNRYIEIKPDTVCDFTDLPFEDNTFKLVVFDPSHLLKAGDTSWKSMIRDGFHECMRVLDEYGTLIFKWSEVGIKVSEIVKVIGTEPLFGPLFGHKSGRLNNTHWMEFMKFPEEG